MKRQWFFFLILVLLLAFVPAHSLAQGTADWTILYYSDADNDLESFMIGDIMEMHLVGSTDDVNIVVQMDRTPGYDEVNGDWVNTRRFLVTQAQTGLSGGDFEISREAFIESLSGIDPAEFGMTEEEFERELEALQNASPEEFEQIITGMGAPPGGGAPAVGIDLQSIEDVGEVESGTPEALVDFATWGISNFPAQRYMLILSDHGGGWLGVTYDETSDNDSLTMPELETALAQIVDSTGIGKFDLVAFDACMMGQLEVYLTIAPYAKYSIASQEVIPGAGWEYVTPLLALVQNPQMDMGNFGKAVIDGYMEYYTNVLQGYDAFDLHLIDLEKVQDVVAALDEFTTAIQANPDSNLKAIGRARDNVQIFSQDDPDAARYFSTVDLIDFMRLLADLTDDRDVQQAAQAVIEAAQSIVIYGNASAALPGSNGVAIYFPANLDDYGQGENGPRYEAEFGDKLISWQAFLATFYGTAMDTFQPADLSIKITEVVPNDGTASVWDPPVILFTTNGEGIVDLQFYAALKLEEENVAILLDASRLEFTTSTPDGETITEYPEGESNNEFTWNVEMPLMTDSAGNSEITVLISNPDNPDTATVSGIYHYRNGSSDRAYLVVDLGTRQVQSVFGIQESPIGQAVGEIRPRNGDTFEPHYRFLDENGQIQLIESGTNLIFSDEPFKFEFVPAASGTYFFTMWIQDMAGNISFDSVEFAVDNEGLDTTYRGFKDLGMGINFLFPWGWTDPDVLVYDDGTYRLDVSDPEGNVSIYVDYYEVESVEEILDYATQTLDGYEAKYDTPEALTLETFDGNSYEAYNIYYSYTTEDGQERVGGQLVVYVPENGFGYIIDVDSLADDASIDLAGQVLSDIMTTIYFFPPRQ